MPYDYQIEKPKLFTEEGQVKLMEVYQNAKRLLDTSGAFRMEKVMPCGDTWTAMAYVDRLVEMGEIREVTKPRECMAQHRVFVAAKK